MNGHNAANAELPRTAYLDHTLRRARTAAEQRSHRYVTLEHLLLALLDDPDALKLIQAVGADLPMIKTSVSDEVNHRMSALAVPDGRMPSFSYKFELSVFRRIGGCAPRGPEGTGWRARADRRREGSR